MICQYHEKCPMFNDKLFLDFPPLTERLKQQYCLDNHNSCARKCILDKIGLEHVPQLMLPQQEDWARQILQDHGVGLDEVNQSFKTDSIKNK